MVFALLRGLSISFFLLLAFNPIFFVFLWKFYVAFILTNMYFLAAAMVYAITLTLLPWVLTNLWIQPDRYLLLRVPLCAILLCQAQ